MFDKDENKTELERELEKIQRLQSQLEAYKADTMRPIREKISDETGIPSKLLRGDTEEECRQFAKELREWNPITYPDVRDGGELPNPPARKKTTKELFSEWMEQNHPVSNLDLIIGHNINRL